MAITCPYCQHSMNAKSIRAGRFTPRCAKCGRSFQLVVTMEPELTFKSTPLPGDANRPASFDPNVTGPSAAEMAKPEAPAPQKPGPARLDSTRVVEEKSSNDADFSVASSLVRSAPPRQEEVGPNALEQTSPPAHAGVNLEGTDAGESGTGEHVAAPDDQEVPPVLGGYQIVKELGRGGMGAVYLARQVSLDRPVALKVMNPKWASNPNFLVRFTREAYAAAQLVHHNIVQVYDIDEVQGINFFSMEYVEGQSLGDLIKKEGRIPAEEAAGYILQAARGLKFAHDRGMIHRDIKPDNLMINNQGVVKVADLGLVRTPGMSDEKHTDEEQVAAPVPIPDRPSGSRGGVVRTLHSLSGVTLAGQAMGTPSYMAPEQARDATKIDHRADIYSLGCTLYVMVTGLPVFTGSTPLEVMTRHAADPVTRPEKVAKEVPKALSDIILKMLAKKPDERYPSMDEVIKVLEDFLGLQAASKQTASEQHVKTLEQSVRAFQKAPAAALRTIILLGSFGFSVALMVLLLLIPGGWPFVSVLFGLVILTTLAYFVVHGVTHRTYVFLKVRDLLLSTTWPERGKIALGLLLFALLLFLMGQFWYWLLAGLLGTGLALGVHYALDRRIAKEREAALAKVESMLKTLRVRGLSEEALQEFVCKFAGEHWEEFFEALFGYEAKLANRLQHGAGPRGPRPRYASWRDPLIRWINSYQRARQEERERKHLKAIEQKSLQAQGVGADEAKARAEAVADAMVQKAAEIKKEPVLPAAAEATVAPEEGKTMPAPKAPPPRRVNLQDMLEIGVKSQTPPRSSGGRSRLPDLLATPVGPTVRFVVGAVLFAIGLLWLHGMTSYEQTARLAFKRGLMLEGVSENEAEFRVNKEFDKVYFWNLVKWGATERPEGATFKFPFLPEIVNRALSGFPPLIAGLALILSTVWRSYKIGFLVLLGAAIMVIGPVSELVPNIGVPVTLVCLAAGGLVVVAGFLFGRDT